MRHRTKLPPGTVDTGPRGWHSRGYLPHFDAGEEYTQSVTFRLADSLPGPVVRSFEDELAGRPTPEREAQLYKLIEEFLDAGRGECHLRNPEIAGLVEGALLHYDAARYAIHAWVVMPNHVHVLFTPTAGQSLSGVVGSWKSFTSKEADKALGRAGQFWHEDYSDRYVRDERHFNAVIEYIESNPVKAGLCAEPAGWPFGSARLRRVAEAGGTPAVQREGVAVPAPHRGKPR